MRTCALCITHFDLKLQEVINFLYTAVCIIHDMRMRAFQLITINSVSGCAGSIRGYFNGEEVNKVGYIDRVNMASSGTLEVFNAEIESIDDYKERFYFHCTANQVIEGRQKVLFLTKIDEDAFLKLKTLVSPTLTTK